MMLKKIDFLSPPISLFYQGLPSHSSTLSGVLSILTIALIIALSIYNLKNLFNREKEIPASTSFTHYIEDAGIIPLSKSSLFHFISLEDYNDKEKEQFNFSFFNIIGFEGFISNYEGDIEIKNYNHWLYGLCNKNSDIKGIEDIISDKYFINSACIRKYFDFRTQQYYETNHPNFKWPSLSHGTCHSENVIYSITIKKCEQNIINEIFNGSITCKDINENDNSLKAFHLYFIDQYIDVLNYNNPISKFLFRVENRQDEDNYSINHLNFKPSMIETHKGYIFDKKNIDISYFFDRNDVFTYKRNNNMYAGYSFYLNNVMSYNERSYKTIPEFLSNIGGFLNIIIIIMSFINNFINSYIILKDFNCLLNLFSITTNDIVLTNQKNILNKKLQELEQIRKNCCAFTKSSSSETLNTEKEKPEEKHKELKEKETETNQSINTERSEITEEPKIVSTNNREELKIGNEKKNDERAFCLKEYLISTITFGKKYDYIELYENFRKKIISVENLMQNYLKMNNLLKSEKRISNLK